MDTNTTHEHTSRNKHTEMCMDTNEDRGYTPTAYEPHMNACENNHMDTCMGTEHTDRGGNAQHMMCAGCEPDSHVAPASPSQ